MPAVTLKEQTTYLSWCPFLPAEQVSLYFFLSGLDLIPFVLSLPAQVRELLLPFLGVFRKNFPRLVIE